MALRVGEFAWPGALLGGALASALWCRWRKVDLLELADCAALALPPAQALASIGLLLSGGPSVSQPIFPGAYRCLESRATQLSSMSRWRRC